MEVKRIADQLRRSYEGDAWHGPALRELLQDVSVQAAAAHPIAGAHSIWEIVMHLEAWLKAAELPCRGEPLDVPDQEDWKEVDISSDAAWDQARQRLRLRVNELCTRIEKLRDDDLRRTVGTRDYSMYFLLHGLVQHNLYHAGQIAILKKASVSPAHT